MLVKVAVTFTKEWWAASIGKFQETNSCGSNDASTYISALVWLRELINTYTLHVANNILRLC